MDEPRGVKLKQEVYMKWVSELSHGGLLNVFSRTAGGDRTTMKTHERRQLKSVCSTLSFTGEGVKGHVLIVFKIHHDSNFILSVLDYDLSDI